MERYEMDGSVWDLQRALIAGRQAATRLSIARSRDRDLAWCERELGDAEHRCVDLATGRPVRVVNQWGADLVPVESLGRDQ